MTYYNNKYMALDNCKKTNDMINDFAINNPKIINKRNQQWLNDVKEFLENVKRTKSIKKNEL